MERHKKDIRHVSKRPVGPVARPCLSARQAALAALSTAEERRRTVWAGLDAMIQAGQLAGRETGLATELAMGVVRHRLTLGRLLNTCVEKGFERVDPVLRNILLLGAYQLIWLEGIPPFAALHEAVEQAKAVSRPAGGFVNAVLRHLQGEIERHRIPADQADPRRAVAVNEHACCQFRGAVLPDPATSPVEYLAEATSHPAWLVSRWVSVFGLEQAREICRYGTCRPPLMLRPNRLRTDVLGLAGRLRDEGYVAQALEDKGVVVVQAGPPITRAGAFADGLCQPQDPTAMIPAQRMNLAPAQVVLDLCAGLGTKSTQMAELMQNAGLVIACDRDAAKLAALRDNARRLGLTIIRTITPAELEAAVKALAAVDWILVDAPCSNSGVLARRPEARYRINARALRGLASAQLDLLETAERLAGPRTALMYSTCSLLPQENEEVAERFAQAHSGWRPIGGGRTFPACGRGPADWRDGGYWAAWVRE